MEKTCKTKNDKQIFKRKFIQLNDTFKGFDLCLDGYGTNYLIDIQDSYRKMKITNHNEIFI